MIRQTSVLQASKAGSDDAIELRAPWPRLKLVPLPIAELDGYDCRCQSTRVRSDHFANPHAGLPARSESRARPNEYNRAGAVHDLRNLAQVIGSALRLIERHVRKSDIPELGQLLVGATGSVNRMAALCQRLLDASQAPRAPNERFRPDLVLSEMRDILELAVGSRVVVDINYGSSAAVSAPRLAFECAILNLAVNSRDAMKGSGTLTISTRDEPASRSSASPNYIGPMLSVAVHDTGSGMSPDVAERALSPFFSTKRGGTGIGLAEVAEFAERAGGTVLIASEPGTDTTITLMLPTFPS